MRLRRTFVAAALAVPLACAAFALMGTASSRAVDAAPGAVTLAVAAETDERASLGPQELASGSLWCEYCPTLSPEECSDNSQVGWPCSAPELNCSCQFCGGELGCVKN